MLATAPRVTESDNLETATILTATRPGLIYKKMAEIMAEVGAVGKNGQATEGPKYAFRRIDDVYLALQQLMARHGVFSLGEVIDHKREERSTRNGGILTFTVLTVRHTFYAEDGSFVQDVTVGEGMDSSDKSSNKATSAAEKYSLVTAFKIPTETLTDSETANPQPAPRQQQQQQQPPRRPGPAPVVQPPPFAKLVRSKLEDRGLRGDEVERAVRGIAESFEVTDLSRLGREDQARVLRGIAQGHADKYRMAQAG
jgi:hypothetical protein